MCSICLQNAYITPLIKKPGLHESAPENCRPVSNLPTLSKLLERAVFQQLDRYLKSANLYPPQQSAYRRFHSTETALLTVCDDIIGAIDDGNTVLLAFLDLSAAFDTVDHDILLQRLRVSFGLSNTALGWFESYLHDRTQYVVFNGQSSTVHRVQYGVPQGSVLGPLLFILYMADIGKIIEEHGAGIHQYADDLQVYFTSKPVETDAAQTKMLCCLSDIADFLESNRLKLNPGKSEFMWCASSRRCSSLPMAPVNFRCSSLMPTQTVRNLGVMLQSDMNFNTHVNRLVSSCFFQLRNIKGCVKSLPVDSLKTVVNSFVISRIDYCNSLLAGSQHYLLDRLQHVMNASARLIVGLKKYDQISAIMRDELHWLRVPERIQFKLSLLSYKCLNGMAPDYLSTMYIRVADLERRSRLRSALSPDVTIPRTRTKFGERAFSVAGPSAWNSLPGWVRSAESVTTFKRLLKTYLFAASS